MGINTLQKQMMMESCGVMVALISVLKPVIILEGSRNLAEC